MFMKHKKIRPIWKLLFFLVLFSIGYYFLLIKDYNKDVSYSSNTVTNIKKRDNTVKDNNIDDTIDRNTEEEINNIKEIKIDTGLYNINSNEIVNISNIYLTDNRTYFKLSEDITIFIEGTLLENNKGLIYITPHDDSNSIYYTLEYDNSNFNNGIVFNINYEEHDFGYYDIHIMYNDIEIALYVFQIGE